MASCVVCNDTVRDRQHCLQCDECLGWQHRVCRSGISQALYRQIVRGEADLGVWACNNCRTPAENDADITDPPTLIDDPPISPASRSANNETMEDSLEESALEEMEIDEQPVPRTYEVVEGASKKGKPQLIDNLGYRFGVQRNPPSGTVHWTCTFRPKVDPCKASVKERDGVFEAGPHEHNHGPDVGAATAAKIAARVKKEAEGDLFKSAAVIVNDVLLEELGDGPCPALSKPEHLARAANRRRQKLRPDEPKDLNFEVDEDFVPPSFLKGDVRVRCGDSERRHLILATDTQVKHLGDAKTWYLDGTFKLCRAPFMQLFTISVFIRKDDCMKSVLMVFVLMSRREKKDYKKVLKKILDILPGPPNVKRAMMDFEKAMWPAMRQVLPDVHLTGCMFHWTQCVFRKIQEVGLQTTYLRKGSTYKYLRMAMSLPFLPEDQIETEWEALKAQASTPHRPG
ncbi:uncharacterized protein LOC118412295 [Branchiostoma floridae]|uniref:Uncharacterized protein LOC118412295 n=1 Tax=Branchiostoma floridae TaxID=7739 RepID=A0A9J7ML36_BRAFL|nr:uncharacterized protein LOC118412295 [Branchiostoma floridae]